MKAKRTIFRWRHLHFGKLSLFALLSVADLFMTWQLVQGSDGQVYESNPIANAWLASFGWVGLSIYKILAMVLVAGSALYISFHRPKAGGRILLFACGTTAVVVGYSCLLSIRDNHLNQLRPNDPWEAEQKSLMLDREMQRQKSYHALLSRLSNDLIDRRCSLNEAVEQLAPTAKAKNDQSLSILRRNYPSRSDAECLAIHVAYHALVTVSHDWSLMVYLADLFETDYRLAYGRTVHFDLTSLAPGRETAHHQGPNRDPRLEATVLLT